MADTALRSPSLFGIVLRFLAEEALQFAGTWFRILRHPFRFFAVTDPADAETLFKALTFFAYSFVAQQALWFVSMLPPLPGAEFLSPGYRSLTIFLGLFCSALVWHLILRAVTRRAVPLRGTMAVVLYNAGFLCVLIIPTFVVLRVVGLAFQRLGGDPVLLFLLLMMPLVGFAVAVLCRWMASYHGVRWIVAFWTWVVAEAIWQALQKYVVTPWILSPAFNLLFALYKRLVYMLVGTLA